MMVAVDVVETEVDDEADDDPADDADPALAFTRGFEPEQSCVVVEAGATRRCRLPGFW
jgi:hypothetical protein